MISKLVSYCTRIKPNEQCVVRCFINDREIAIIGVSIPSERSVDLYTQVARNFRQLMSLFLPKPKLSSEVTKAIFVFVFVLFFFLLNFFIEFKTSFTMLLKNKH